MGLPPRDFKSLASTDFATPAGERSLSAPKTTDPSLPFGRSGQGAGNGTRTRDPNLGKVVLYQLSYSRVAGIYAEPIYLTTSNPLPQRVHRVPRRPGNEPRQGGVTAVHEGFAIAVDDLGGDPPV
jgi:hypothetical protein